MRLCGFAVDCGLLFETGLSQFEPLELDPVSMNLCKVVLRLLRKPAFGAASEDLGQSHGHFGRNPALLIHQFRQGGARDAKRGGGVRDGQVQRARDTGAAESRRGGVDSSYVEFFNVLPPHLDFAFVLASCGQVIGKLHP